MREGKSLTFLLYDRYSHNRHYKLTKHLDSSRTRVQVMGNINRSVTLLLVFKNCQTLAIQGKFRNWCIRNRHFMSTQTLRPCLTTEVALMLQARFTPWCNRGARTFFRILPSSCLQNWPMAGALCSRSTTWPRTTRQTWQVSWRDRIWR